MGIADRVKQRGEAQGYTLASIERELSFGQGSIRNWNKAAPSADKLYKVAKLLRVSMEYLVFGEDLSDDYRNIGDQTCESTPELGESQNMPIGERISALLAEQHKKTKDLAIYIGVDPSTITGWINGNCPSAKYIEGISQFLGISMEYVLTGVRKQPMAPVASPDNDDCTEMRLTSDELDVIRKMRCDQEHRDSSAGIA